MCFKDDSEGDDFEPADGDLDDEDEDEEGGESEEGIGLSAVLSAIFVLMWKIVFIVCTVYR